VTECAERRCSCSFGRNLAYYRAGFEEIGKSLMKASYPHASFMNSNSLDQCVLERCTLFGDSKGEASG
jgi:hypothetical protein